MLPPHVPTACMSAASRQPSHPNKRPTLTESPKGPSVGSSWTSSAERVRWRSKIRTAEGPGWLPDSWRTPGRHAQVCHQAQPRGKLWDPHVHLSGCPRA